MTNYRVRIDAECPACHAIVRMNPATGVYQSHAWINGCTFIGPSVIESNIILGEE